MADRNKNLLIGIFVTAALAIIVYILLFLHPSVGDQKQILHARFTNIDKVNVGTRVLFAGHPVGEVIEIKEIPEARSSEFLYQDQVFIYELTLRIDSRLEVYTTDIIAVRTSGLLGEKSVAILPQPAKPGIRLVRVTNQILYAEPTGTVEDTFKELNDVGELLKGALKKVNYALDEMQRGQFWENISGAAGNINAISKALNEPEDLNNIVKQTNLFVGRLNDLEERFSKTWTNVDDTVNNIKEVSMKIDNGTGSLGKFINNDEIYNHFADVAAGIQSGQGSLGQLLVKDDFYLRLTSVMTKAETLMDDINHYGLLFQNDKGWQRLRARRANLMQKLKTPQEFQNFFNDEINEVSTSLSRVTMLLMELERNPESFAVFCDPDFVKLFADLLRRVDGLDKNLQMYNNQVVEIREECCCPPLLMDCVE